MPIFNIVDKAMKVC